MRELARNRRKPLTAPPDCPAPPPKRPPWLSWVTLQGYAGPLLIVLALLFFVGANARLHGASYEHGFSFYLAVLLLFYKGRQPAASFFGVPPLAVFILLHIALFGLSLLPLLCTFALFRHSTQLIWPVALYLSLDSAYLYFPQAAQVDNWLALLGKIFFAKESLLALAIVPLAYLAHLVEKALRKQYGETFIGQYGPMIALCSLMYFFGLSMLFLKLNSLSYWFLVSSILYTLTIIRQKHNAKLVLLTFLPLLFLFALIEK